ncbi:aminotransferase A [Sutcliffiella rhizosphaerae]|uniref:Aminotransferase n=1 Tax=Sutcliffiella rhizosphaerae TaxID=2880967 RepID=A0ABM8YLA2_9BACI|nr:aminotransferase A [Sutcliffiella rhizosphaerae]CAG9620628.1 putative N-acetyl-LL-diaminopimelate aminotransferase [Sutcliffiella rhizosphaerae]
MEHLINSNVREIEISGIRKFFNLVSQYDDVISLTIGQPDFHTPSHVKEAAHNAIDNNKTNYTPNAGLPELRRAAAHFVQHKYGLSYEADSEVIVSIGASQGIDIAFRTILEPGVEVILPGPIYPGYEPLIKLCGATPVYIDTRDTYFKITAKQIEQHLTDKTRCIILPYPSNPTGVAIQEEELIKIATLLKDKDIFILSDEIYSELVFTGKHHSIANYPGMKEKTIVINGVSKSHSMTGWRIGLVFGPEYVMKQMLKVHQYNVSCASSISQYAALEALTEGINDAEVMSIQYKERMEYVHNRLVKMGLDVVKPDGAFYLFPSIQKYGISSFDFAQQLVENAGIAVVPGSAFSPLGEGFVRVSYAYNMETLVEAMDRFENYLTTIS